MANSLTEEKPSKLGHPDPGFLEQSWIIFHKGDQILGKLPQPETR